MTKAGKCETCRQRKVKCDERRPTCVVCEGKGRSCMYAKENVNIFIHEHFAEPTSVDRSCFNDSSTALTLSNDDGNDRDDCSAQHDAQALTLLRLKRRKGTESGGGEFLIFRPVQRKTAYMHRGQRSGSHQAILTAAECPGSLHQSSPAPTIPLSPQEALLAGLIFAMGTSVLEIAPFGDWVKSPWVCAKNELAIDFMMSSMQLLKNRNEFNLQRAYRAGHKAIRSLRERLELEQDDQLCLELLHAIMMHYAAEQFVSVGTFSYVTHVNGAAYLLQSLRSIWRHSVAIQSIASSLCEDEILTAMLANRSTPLEGFTSVVRPLPIGTDISTATRAAECLLYRLPRLVRLVRWAAGNARLRSTPEIVVEAVDMATGLLHSEEDAYVRQTVAAFSTREPAATSATAAPTEERVFNFPCVQVYTLTLQYYLYRVILCGLLQTLYVINNTGLQIHRSEIEKLDVEGATRIAMCTNYALHAPTSSPLVALKMIIPLQIGFGAWHRLKSGRGSAHRATYVRAAQMECWHLVTLQTFENMWHALPSEYNRLAAIVDALEGGPVPAWMLEYRAPGFCESSRG